MRVEQSDNGQDISPYREVCQSLSPLEGDAVRVKDCLDLFIISGYAEIRGHCTGKQVGKSDFWFVAHDTCRKLNGFRG
jgi:hypothetical protein